MAKIHSFVKFYLQNQWLVSFQAAVNLCILVRIQPALVVRQGKSIWHEVVVFSGGPVKILWCEVNSHKVGGGL